MNTKASATVRFVSPNVLHFIRFHSCYTEGTVTLQHCRLESLISEALISDCVRLEFLEKWRRSWPAERPSVSQEWLSLLDLFEGQWTVPLPP